VQIAVDTRERTYRLIVQPIGEMPKVVGSGACGEAAQNQKLNFVIRPSKTAKHITCYDNIEVTSN
jgi:hypothetical protein